MSKEQLTEQQAQVGTAAPESAPDQTHGLPSHVYAQVMGLGPADAPALADLLILYSGLSVRILTVASPHVGNAAVQRAITIAQNKSKTQGQQGSLNQGDMHAVMDEAPGVAKPQGKSGTVSQSEMHEYMDEAPSAVKPQGKPGTVSQSEMHEYMDEAPSAAKPQGKPGALNLAEMHEVMDDKPAQGKPGTMNLAEMHEVMDDKPAAEPAWVGGARKYNDRHAELVSDFNDATGNSCLDATSKLDPQAVARWQRQHGVEADGKVGPHTLAAARQASAKASPAAAAADQRIPV